MATTAEALRKEIEEYLDARIRCKGPADRTQRESNLLEKLQAASEDLLHQEQAKRRQQLSALDAASEDMLSNLLRISTAKKKILRLAEEAEEA